ncbi:MAG: hypothetical protein EOP11_22045 [Proteobacteria bacterium]|nr:MAG: hypothetical protein EOP11_22045 [Pseudomonadota bacterium]
MKLHSAIFLAAAFFTSSLALAAPSVEELNNNARRYDESQRVAAPSMKEWDQRFRANGCRMALGADIEDGFRSNGVDLGTAYWQYPRAKSGACKSGAGLLVSDRGFSCSPSGPKGFYVAQFTTWSCRTYDGAPAFDVRYANRNHWQNK